MSGIPLFPVILTAQFLLGAATPGQGPAPATLPAVQRPFGTLREQAALQQAWLKQRLDAFLPALMRKHGVDLWVVPMRAAGRSPLQSSGIRVRF